MNPIDPASLITQRLRLRVPTDDDTHALLALYGNEAVMRHWSHPAWTCSGQARAAIADAHDDRAHGRALHLLIVSRSDGCLAGSCALFDIHPQHRRATLGYLLAPPYWGQGLAAEAVRALLAANLIGDGLYGVDMKMTARGPVVIEVNDNPNIDAGAEDSVLRTSCIGSCCANSCAGWMCCTGRRGRHDQCPASASRSAVAMSIKARSLGWVCALAAKYRYRPDERGTNDSSTRSSRPVARSVAISMSGR